MMLHFGSSNLNEFLNLDVKCVQSLFKKCGLAGP